MKRISEIISMPVISLYEGEYLGLIFNLLFDYKQKKCTYAVLINEDDNIPKLIKTSNIFSIGNDCIFIKNNSEIDLECNCQRELYSHLNPINLAIYNTNGNYMGVCSDITINDKFEIKTLIYNDTEIEINKLFNVSKNAILLSDKNESFRKYKPKHQIIKTNNKDEKVVILSNTNVSKTTQALEAQSNKILTDYRFLIGRTLQQDIIAHNGEIIAKKDSIVTKEIVNKSSYFGKLVEIARFSTKKK